jgi:hypothetical protein
VLRQLRDRALLRLPPALLSAACHARPHPALLRTPLCPIYFSRRKRRGRACAYAPIQRARRQEREACALCRGGGGVRWTIALDVPLT